jgi:hypothetical protein
LDINNDPLANFGEQAFQRPYPGLEYDFTDTVVTVTRNLMRWTPIHSEDGFFGAEPFDNFEQIYHLYILSPTQRDAHLHSRHDDDLRVWNNGVLVISRDGRDGGTERQQDFVLRKGLNSITAKFEEGAGSNYFAMGITDLSGQPFTDLSYSFGPSVFLTDAYAVRRLQKQQSCQWGDTLQVDLVLKVNPDNPPQSVVITENIPPGIPAANVTAPGSVVAGGKIVWNLTGANVRHQTLSYSLIVPAGFTCCIHFEGTLTFDGTTVDIHGDQGDERTCPVPSAHLNLTVEMLQAAHLNWSPPETEGLASYNVYRSVNLGPFELIGSTTATTYTDKWVQPANNYSYRVTAVNVEHVEGEPTPPTSPASVPTMDICQAEDFNYDGGKYPGHEGCPPAIEAPDGRTIGTPQEYDYWHPNDGGRIVPPPWPQPGLYRAEAPWIETAEEADNPGVFCTYIGWIDPGSWWRYTFDVREAGWVKFEFRVAAPSNATLAVYWDANSNGEEQLIGTVTVTTGNWHIFTWALMEDQVQTTVGIHTLRVQSVAGSFNFDKIAILWNAPPPARWTIWEDNFDSYASTADVFSPTVGKWTRGNTTNSAGSWTLWDTEGPDLGSAPTADIAGMEDKYMISDSDLSGAGVLIDEEMLSPEVDCADWTKLRLNFNKNYRIFDDPNLDRTQDAEVDIRSFDPVSGWSNWTNLLHLDRFDVDPNADPPELSDPEVFDLSAYDGKKIQLKFHFFKAEYDYWFAIDNVRVSGIAPPPELPPYNGGWNFNEDTLEMCVPAYRWSPLTVQYCDDLAQGNWLPIPGVAWPLTESRCVVDDIRGIRHRFYRLKAE